MARFINIVLLCGITAVPAAASAQVSQADAASFPVINGHVTPGEFRALSFSSALKRCADPRCIVLRSLVSSYDKLRRYYTPNTMARSEDNPPATQRPRLAVQDAVLNDARQLTTIAGDLVVIGRDIPEWSSEMLTIEIAILTDPSGQTVHHVIEAIPRTPALAGVITAARERCETNGERGCKAIMTTGGGGGGGGGGGVHRFLPVQ